MKKLLIILVLTLISTPIIAAEKAKDDSVLYASPVFITDEQEIPVSILGIDMTDRAKYQLDASSSFFASEEVRKDGQSVLPWFDAKMTTMRVGGQLNAGKNWAVRLSIPWTFSSIGATIDNRNVSQSWNSIGDVALFVRKRLWQKSDGTALVASAGIELPTGKDDERFAQSNASANAFYSNSSRRMPISWQAGNGATDTYLSLAYGKYGRKLSYVGILASKFHGTGDEDVKVGKTLIGSFSTTYSPTRNAAFSCSLVYKKQSNDSYPNLPASGVDPSQISAVTSHGTSLSLDPSFRYTTSNRTAIGIGFKYPIVKPDDGLVLEPRVYLIVIPKF